MAKPFLCGTHQLNTGNVYCGALSGRVSLPKPLDWLTNWGTVLVGCHKWVPKYRRLVKACVGCLKNVSSKFCTEENHHNLQTLAGLKVCPAFPFHLLELRIACSADWTAKSDGLNLAKEQSGAIQKIETALFFAIKTFISSTARLLTNAPFLSNSFPSLSKLIANSTLEWWAKTTIIGHKASFLQRPICAEICFQREILRQKSNDQFSTLQYGGNHQNNKKLNP